MSEPSIHDLRADARLVCDFQGRKVGVYANAAGHVVLFAEEDGERRYIEVLPGEVELMCALLMRAAAEGRVLMNYLESQYETYVAIEHAKGAD
jgi:hypothetical protein